MDAHKLGIWLVLRPSKLFDSGDTLITPLGGTWWPNPTFRRLVASGRLGSFTDSAIDTALECGMQFLDRNHFVTNVQEEVEHFRHNGVHETRERTNQFDRWQKSDVCQLVLLELSTTTSSSRFGHIAMRRSKYLRTDSAISLSSVDRARR